MANPVRLPAMGEGIHEAQISRWLVRPGDTVALHDPLVEVETDKVTNEITAEGTGVILQVCIEEGEIATVGSTIAWIGQPGETPTETKPTQTTSSGKPSIPRPTPATAMTQNGTRSRSGYSGRISPVVSRMVDTHNLDLDLISGTGKHGRITKADVLAYLEQAQSQTESAPPSSPLPQPIAQTPQPSPQRTASADGTLNPLSGMRRAIAEHMVMSKRESPHATTIFEIDLSAVTDHRAAHKAEFKSKGVKLTFMAYIASAVIAGLQEVPQVNSEWRDSGIFHHRPIHLGIATAVDDGLVVPVIRSAERLNLFGLAQSIESYAQQARNKGIKSDDLKGGTFTITNHGVFGSLFATPIINQPQCGIMGVGAIEKRVCVVNDMIAIRPKAYFSFAFDHRILDGADADRFMQTVKQTLEGWPT